MRKLKYILTAIFSLALTFSLVACGGGNGGGNQSNQPNAPLTGESDILVTYFSWSSANNTKTMAEYIQEATGGEIFRIQPETPYTSDYDAVIDVAQQEQREGARPALFENLTQEQIDSYDIIFVGYPVWWYDAPMIIYSFLESNDFSDKTIITFATSGGSGLSDSDLKSAIDANFISGICISNFSAGSNAQNRVENWITELGYHK